MTPLGRALGSARVQADLVCSESEKRNKTPDVTHEVTVLWWNRDLHMSSEEEEAKATFWQLPPTPGCGAGPEPTSLGLSHSGWGASPCTHPSATQQLLPARRVLDGLGRCQMPRGRGSARVQPRTRCRS